MEKIVSLCKRRGLIFPGSEIYGGLAGTYDYGPLGLALKNNIKNSWWKKFVDDRRDMYGVDAALLMNPRVWEVSGHVAGFADPMVECMKCNSRFRLDQLPGVTMNPLGLGKDSWKGERGGLCPKCGVDISENFSEPRLFNMMFATKIGAVEDSAATVYFRPETAQGMFVNFKNIVDSFHPKLPFGMAQIGKAFRNEITPKDFVFRVREFEQMEIEYFIKPEDWEKYFEFFRTEMLAWMSSIGLRMDQVHELEVSPEDLAHYSKRTIDFEFDYPFGRKELYGLAYRTDFDLKNHKLEYLNEETQEKITPHVIEPSFGVDRTILALLLSVYEEEEKEGETRVFLKLKPSIAPTVCAVSPLLKNKPQLVEKAESVFSMLKSEFGRVSYDDNGNIGKRYRRQDEIGTPWCIVIDFDTLENDTVTIRDRDTGSQERVPVGELISYIKERLSV